MIEVSVAMTQCGSGIGFEIHQLKNNLSKLYLDKLVSKLSMNELYVDEEKKAPGDFWGE